MIVDSLNNIAIYKTLSTDIFDGLKFLAEAKPDINLGIYIINKNTQAIVSEYETVEIFERGYEAHKHVVDIQYPIIGLEKVKWSPIEDMSINLPYDANKDRTFFINPSSQGIDAIIGNGIFAIMFPGDGHSPQHIIDKPELIKKITVKVSIINDSPQNNK